MPTTTIKKLNSILQEIPKEKYPDIEEFLIDLKEEENTNSSNIQNSISHLKGYFKKHNINLTSGEFMKNKRAEKLLER